MDGFVAGRADVHANLELPDIGDLRRAAHDELRHLPAQLTVGVCIKGEVCREPTVGDGAERPVAGDHILHRQVAIHVVQVGNLRVDAGDDRIIARDPMLLRRRRRVAGGIRGYALDHRADRVGKVRLDGQRILDRPVEGDCRVLLNDEPVGVGVPDGHVVVHRVAGGGDAGFGAVVNQLRVGQLIAAERQVVVGPVLVHDTRNGREDLGALDARARVIGGVAATQPRPAEGLHLVDALAEFRNDSQVHPFGEFAIRIENGEEPLGTVQLLLR